MCYENYLKYLLGTCDDIYIDTSTLMNVEALRRFLESGKDDFSNSDNKIIVTAAVLSELKNHQQYDSNADKRERALVASELINTYPDIFKFEKEDESTKIDYSFADRDFLSRLTLNKSSRRQLLITNDRKLGQDAYRINEQESNKGCRIMICYINFYGGICRCTCTKDEERNLQEVDAIENIEYIEKKCRAVSHGSSTAKKTTASCWKYTCVFAGGLAGGIAIDRWAVPFIKRTLFSA